jgi:diacylglycerol kinase (ATP)
MAKHNQAAGLRRVWNAALYSVAGIRAAWSNEAAFRQETMLCLVLIPAAFWVGSNALEHALLIGSCLFVLVVELLNSSIEATVDRIGEEMHTLAGRAKDMASAAVFISLLLALVCWGLIGYERFLA